MTLLPSANLFFMQLREGRCWDDIRERDAILNVDIGIGYLFDQGVVYDSTDGVSQHQAEGVECAWKFLQGKLGAECLGRAGQGECPDTGSGDYQLQAATREGRASRRADLNRCIHKAEIAENFVRRSRCRSSWHRIDKRIGERAASRIATRADIGEQLFGPRFCCTVEEDSGVGQEGVGCSLAVAVSAREDIRALWWEDDRRADERRSRRRYRNDRTRLTELRQYFQLHFCFYLDLFADDDFQFHHAAQEHIADRHALNSSDTAEDVGFIQWFRQAQHDFVIELNGGREFAQQRAVGKYTDQESCAKQEADDPDTDDVSVNDDVFAPDANDGARKVQRLCWLWFRD